MSANLAPNATIAARADMTDTLCAFTFALDSALGEFKPGQYVSLGVAESGGLTQRPYSIVSVDDSGRWLELFIRRVRDGALSGRLWPLAVGSRVRVGPARGLFALDPADQRERLLIGTGTGLAPLLAMLESMALRGDTTRAVLIHGVSYQDELAFGERVQGWVEGGLPIDYLPAVSRPDDPRNASWPGLVGRADAILGRVLAEWPSTRGGVAYMCGNPDMVEACSKVLADAGFVDSDIRAEKFHAPPARPRAQTAVSQ